MIAFLTEIAELLTAALMLAVATPLLKKRPQKRGFEPRCFQKEILGGRVAQIMEVL